MTIKTTFRRWLLHSLHRSLDIQDLAFEIQQDIDARCMPPNCRSFSQIWDHINQNHVDLRGHDQPAEALKVALRAYKRWSECGGIRVEF